MLRGNINTDLPDASGEETFETLAAFQGKKVRVERIVSAGQTTPEGYWYDQAWDEWVLVLTGAAELIFDAPADAQRLNPGDWILIPAGRRHRVVHTSSSTVWLAVHADTP